MEYISVGNACDDCVIAIANNDYSGMPEKQARITLAGIERIGKYLVIGGEKGFMWQGCDVCMSRAGGNKHEVGYLAEGTAK